MKPLLKRKKGFTLIELLIVIVIIGILAALILPRFMVQTRAATYSEAINTLGAVRRAQVQASDAAGGAAYTAATFNVTASPMPSTAWTALGLGDLGVGSRFNYACTAGAINSNQTCVATPTAASNMPVADTVTINIDTAAITCQGALTAVTDPAGSTVGCR